MTTSAEPLEVSPQPAQATNFESNDRAGRQVLVAMATVMLYLGIGKLAGALREVVIAWRFGVGPTVDAYVFVVNLYLWLPSLMLSVLGAVLVPIVMRRTAGTGGDPRFVDEVLGATVAIGLVLSVLAFVAAPAIAAMARPGSEAAPLIEPFARTLSPMLVLGAAIAPVSVLLMAAGRHVNTLFEAVPGLTVCAAVLAWASGASDALVVGLLVGLVAQLALLSLALMRAGRLPRPRLGFGSPAWRGFGSALGLLLAGQLLMSLVSVVDQIVAVRLGPGELSTFSYAGRVLALLTGLGATAVGRAILPVASRLVAAGDRRGAARLARAWALRVLAASVAATLLAWAVAPQAVELLYMRGAFTQQDADAVTRVFRWGLLQLPFYLSGVVLVQLIASQGRHRLIAAVAVVNLAVKLAGNALLAPSLGVNGLMLATALMYMTSATVFWFVTRHGAE